MINESHEISAPGPTGQMITLYKLRFQEIPGIFTAAMNQLVFNTSLHPIASSNGSRNEKSSTF